MRTVDWSSWMVSPESPGDFTDPGDGILWEDPVRGTRFGMSAKAHSEKVKRVMEKVSSVGDLDSALALSGRTNGEPAPGFDVLPWWDGTRPATASMMFKDAARLFIAFAYLTEGTAHPTDGFRLEAWRAFCRLDTSRYSLAWRALRRVASKASDEDPELARCSVKLLKGGPYKLKRYFLESSNLKEIRGASTLIEWLGENMGPWLAVHDTIPELLMYTGGGNLLAILPASTTDSLALEIESIYLRYTITLRSAYVLVDSNLSEITGTSYTAAMSRLESVLEERKRLKPVPLLQDQSPFQDGTIWREMVLDSDSEGVSLRVEFRDVAIKDGETCTSCRVRRAPYAIRIGSDTVGLCGSCLHKHLVGRSSKTRLHGILSGTLEGQDPSADTLEDLAVEGAEEGAKEYIAVIYADGNNMGGILQRMDTLARLMYFSRTASKAAMETCRKTFQSTGTKKIEMVAVGGDDFFMIIPSAKAIPFATGLIQNFNREFANLSQEGVFSATLSVGLAIGRFRTPIRTLVEEAEDRLRSAKAMIRRMDRNAGSLDFTVFRGEAAEVSDTGEETAIGRTLRPLLLPELVCLTETVQELRHQETVKSAVHKLKYASERMESDVEFQLFYLYQQARSQRRIDGTLRKSLERFGQVRAGLVLSSAHRTPSTFPKPRAPWADILDMWDFCRR
jgi:CRISPR-associated protein Cmr2